MNRDSKIWQWVLQSARDRIINGLRRRRSHPDVVEAGANEALLQGVPSDSPEMLVEWMARDERRAAVCEALDILRQAQPRRQALPQREPEAPALFPNLTRDQARLQAPRWISGKRLRIGQDEVSLDELALLIVFILVGMYGILALQYVRTQTVADRNELALALVTAKDVVPLRLAATSGFPGAANGTYWGRVGTERFERSGRQGETQGERTRGDAHHPAEQSSAACTVLLGCARREWLVRAPTRGRRLVEVQGVLHGQ